MANERGRSLPPINTLMAFESAGRLGSFSEAADELSLTQSAISQQIRKLEDLIEQRLFFRKGSGVRLTKAGGLLFETISKMLGDLAPASIASNRTRTRIPRCSFVQRILRRLADGAAGGPAPDTPAVRSG